MVLQIRGRISICLAVNTCLSCYRLQCPLKRFRSSQYLRAVRNNVLFTFVLEIKSFTS